jgi:glycosyltransferase involved in cell wall biosynthesis
VISDYPRNSSPYFAAFEAAAAQAGLPVSFAPELPGAGEEPGVINLHRLKRLYRTPGGEPDDMRLDRLLAHLDGLRSRGFQIVWTLHNLYPIDGPVSRERDHRAALGVLSRTDAVLCHTEADAASIRLLAPHARVEVAGWGGLPSGEVLSAPTASLLESIPQDRPVFMMLGNQAPYKEVPRVCEAFLAATRHARLVIAGPRRQPAPGEGLPTPSGERLLFWNHRVEPSEAHHLLRRASWAVCHYASQGRYEYFRAVLFPSSVASAVCAGVPVLAPDLGAVREITEGHRRILYEDAEHGMARAFAEADSVAAETRPAPWPAVVESQERWRRALARYRKVFDELCGLRSRA